MAGLKELRTRIGSIKSTQKITSAMKMVAAARLRRSQDLLAKSKTYNDGLLTIAGRLYKDVTAEAKAMGCEPLYPLIMQPKPSLAKHLLVVFSSPPLSSFSVVLWRNITPHPPGPGLPEHAPSVNISMRYI